jgi:hypothetical protein
MNIEWAFGDLIILAFCAYELWSLRQYKRKHPEIDRSKAPDDKRA